TPEPGHHPACPFQHEDVYATHSIYARCQSVLLCPIVLRASRVLHHSSHNSRSAMTESTFRASRPRFGRGRLFQSFCKFTRLFAIGQSDTYLVILSETKDL